MKVSVLLSIYNRSKLFEYGLVSLLSQSMPYTDWEIVLADDMSTEDLSRVYGQYAVNVRHIRFNPKDHPNYKGYHTQSLALNLAAKHAKGEVLLISQPEVIHDVDNLRRGYDQAMQNELVYGQTILTHRKFTDWLLNAGMIHGFGHLWDEANKLATPFGDNELYWYVAFVKKNHFMKIHGVEEVYMEGVYAEDDEFKERLRLAGVLPALNKAIRGIHVNHEFESDLYPKQDRNASFWNQGAEHNRSRFFKWLEESRADGQNPKDWIIANKHLDQWGDEKYIVEIKERNA